MMRRLSMSTAKVQQSMVNRTVANRSFTSSSKRLGGGGGHGHGHGHHQPAEPYAAHHHPTYPSEAHIFGIDPTVPYKSEGWEWLTLVTYVLCFAVVAFGTNSGTDKFNSWARAEAVARQKVIENGGEVEFGKIYQIAKYESDDSDESEHGMPTEKADE